MLKDAKGVFFNEAKLACGRSDEVVVVYFWVQRVLLFVALCFSKPKP